MRYYSYKNTNLNKLSNDRTAEFRNKHIGVVLQEYNLILDFTVKENILLPKVFHKDKTNDLKLITELLGIDFLLDKKAKYLSGVEQQRVAVARAMINNPNLILADEPTGNLDNDNSLQLYEMLKRLNEKGITVVVVTHNLSFGEKFDIKYNLENGSLVKV